EFFKAQAQKEFHGIETCAVHVVQHGQHHARGHPVGPQADVAIAQRRIDNSYFSHLGSLLTHSALGVRTDTRGERGLIMLSEFASINDGPPYSFPPFASYLAQCSFAQPTRGPRLALCCAESFPADSVDSIRQISTGF